MEFDITPMRAGDWPAVSAIYREGIDTGDATFETTVPSWEYWDRGHLPTCRLVARSGEGIVGWAALAPVSGRRIYAGVAQVSVYVKASARGQGIGRALLRALVEVSEGAGLWTLQAGIFPENRISIYLHMDCGFRTVGRRERLGQLHGVWRDVVLMERRSPVVGA